MNEYCSKDARGPGNQHTATEQKESLTKSLRRERTNQPTNQSQSDCIVLVSLLLLSFISILRHRNSNMDIVQTQRSNMARRDISPSLVARSQPPSSAHEEDSHHSNHNDAPPQSSSLSSSSRRPVTQETPERMTMTTTCSPSTIEPEQLTTTQRRPPRRMIRNPFQRLRAPPHRRRARSLDEHLLRRNHAGRYFVRPTPLVLLEDHYRVDHVPDDPHHRVVILPGVPRYDPDWARDSHDFFNLVVLIPVVVLNVMCWDWDVLLHAGAGSATSKGGKSMATTSAAASSNTSLSSLASQSSASVWMAQAWTGEWFSAFFAVTALYFLVDLLWIIVLPSCVKSPSTIIQHHIATMLYILIPYSFPQYQWCMGACMIVEVNTWFLIARRVFNKQAFPPWIIDLSFVSIRVKLISIFFYITWIGIRCVLYPYLMIAFYQNWMQHSQKVGTKINLVMLCVPLHAIFCLLNLKWSYDLLLSKIRYWRRKGKEDYAVSKGL